MNLISFLLAFLAGAVGSVQGSVNSLIGKGTGQYVMIASVSLVQIIFSIIIIFLRGERITMGLGTVSWVVLSGLMGVIVMFSVSYSIGHIGTLYVFILLIFGQVVLSAVISHFGWFGIPQSPISIQKIGSIMVILFGVICLVKSS
jgi:transporter family-2 protein